MLPPAEVCDRLRDRRDAIRPRLFIAQEKERDALRLEQRRVPHRLDHAPPWPRTVTSATLLREPLAVPLPVGHPLAAEPVLSPRDVADQPWITVHDGFPLMATIEAIAASADRALDIVHRINEFTVVAEVVAAGGGVALMPELGYAPVNRYLPPRPRRAGEDVPAPVQEEALDTAALPPVLRWLDRVLSR